MNIKIYVINLERSPVRWKRIQEHLSKLGLAFERIDAIDAKALNMADVGYDCNQNRRSC